MLLLKLFQIILLGCLLTSCMVGPNFYKPPLPLTCRYTPCPQPTKTVATQKVGKSGKAQQFISCLDIPSQWWTLYHSPEINELICLGIQNNPTLQSTIATLKQAQETVNAQIGSTLLPQVDANLSGQRQRFPNSFGVNTGNPGIFNSFNTGVTVTYTLDIFGGARRQVEALCAKVHYHYFQVEAAYLTLTTNITTTAITIASLKAQIEATYELIKTQKHYLRIVKQQFESGSASAADIYSQETLLAQTEATLAPLKQRLDVNLHLLSILIGEYPCLDRLPNFVLNKFELPVNIPLSIPSLLVRHRPDIQASEALLHQASAQIGVATANLFPQLTLNGDYGWQSTVFATLFNPANVAWNYGGQLLQPIFHGGALLAERRASIAAYEAAFANYRETVLQGFKNVADSLRALEHDAQALRDRKKQEVSAGKALYIAQKQYELGAVNYLTLLIAQRQFHEARILLIQAEASRYTDTAALFQALGGGWWNRPC